MGAAFSHLTRQVVNVASLASHYWKHDACQCQYPAVLRSAHDSEDMICLRDATEE
jgi:hypothetical protein